MSTQNRSTLQAFNAKVDNRIIIKLDEDGITRIQ